MRRRLLYLGAIALLLWWAPRCVARVQAVSSFSNAGSAATTINAVGNNNAVVVGISSVAGVTGISDNGSGGSNTYFQCAAQTSGKTQLFAYVYVKTGITNAPTVVTVTAPGSLAVTVTEVSGLYNVTALGQLDAHNTNLGNNSTPTVSLGPCNNKYDYLFAVANSTAIWTTPAPFNWSQAGTATASGVWHFADDLVTYGSGTFNPAWRITTGSWSVAAVAFKGMTAIPPPNVIRPISRLRPSFITHGGQTVPFVVQMPTASDVTLAGEIWQDATPQILGHGPPTPPSFVKPPQMIQPFMIREIPPDESRAILMGAAISPVTPPPPGRVTIAPLVEHWQDVQPQILFRGYLPVTPPGPGIVVKAPPVEHWQDGQPQFVAHGVLPVTPPPPGKVSVIPPVEGWRDGAPQWIQKGFLPVTPPPPGRVTMAPLVESWEYLKPQWIGHGWLPVTPPGPSVLLIAPPVEVVTDYVPKILTHGVAPITIFPSPVRVLVIPAIESWEDAQPQFIRCGYIRPPSPVLPFVFQVTIGIQAALAVSIMTQNGLAVSIMTEYDIPESD